MDRQSYTVLISTVILFVGFASYFLGASLFMKTDSVIVSQLGGLAVESKFSHYATMVENDSIRYFTIVKNISTDPIHVEIYPAVMLQSKIVYNGTIESGDIPAGKDKSFDFLIPLEKVGRNSIGINIKTNPNSYQQFGLVSFYTFNVVTQDRYYQIQDQQLYYYLGGIIAIPAVISTIKNLKDIFERKQKTKSNHSGSSMT